MVLILDRLPESFVSAMLAIHIQSPKRIEFGAVQIKYSRVVIFSVAEIVFGKI